MSPPLVHVSTVVRKGSNLSSFIPSFDDDDDDDDIPLLVPVVVRTGRTRYSSIVGEADAMVVTLGTRLADLSWSVLPSSTMEWTDFLGGRRSAFVVAEEEEELEELVRR